MVYNNGIDIPRGSVVEFDASQDNLFYVAIAGADPGEAIGVAQFDIPAGKAAYVLVRGKGKVEVVTAGTKGNGLKLAANGDVEDAGAGEATMAVALEAGTGLKDAFLLLKY